MPFSRSRWRRRKAREHPSFSLYTCHMQVVYKVNENSTYSRSLLDSATWLVQSSAAVSSELLPECWCLVKCFGSPHVCIPQAGQPITAQERWATDWTCMFLLLHPHRAGTGGDHFTKMYLKCLLLISKPVWTSLNKESFSHFLLISRLIDSQEFLSLQNSATEFSQLVQLFI